MTQIRVLELILIYTYALLPFSQFRAQLFISFYCYNLPS